MELYQRHGWRVGPAQARELQLRLAGLVDRGGQVAVRGLVAGVDVSVAQARLATAAVVVMESASLAPVETSVARGEVEFPYVPGLLSFREAPLVLEACRRLMVVPELFLVDGQGIAHPRRLGLASHLGLFLEVPTVGCAKSRLVGSHGEVGAAAGSWVELVDGDEVVGAVVRTRTGVRPVYVSIGHRVDLPSAVKWVLACCRGYRLPEPLRLAHLLAGGHLTTVWKKHEGRKSWKT